MRFKILVAALFYLPAAFSQIYLYQEPWGKDAGTQLAQREKPKPTHSLPVEIAHQVIWFHQNVISPVDGPRSHFRPSSSQYMKTAIEDYGFLKGFIMGCDRLLRENNDSWVYRTIDDNGQIFKYDPASPDKYR